MKFPIPCYSKKQINRAGNVLISNSSDLAEEISSWEIVSTWRSAHGYPINTFQATLREKLKNIDPNALVAQRLKRFSSILSKLRRNSGMQLSRMQDIGGLRAIVQSIPMVNKLESNYRESHFAHEICKTDDYISNPKTSGYRSLHLIFRYNNPRAIAYNGLHLELQIRTKLQHAWATSVETMGTFLNHSLKSSEGPKEWLDFFKLVSAAFCHIENSKIVPGFEGMSNIDIKKRIITEERRLDVINRLRAFSVAARSISTKKSKGSFHLIVLNLENRTVNIQSFGRQNIDEANRLYSEIEKKIEGGRNIQAVLVSAGHIDNLKKAYPNYFLDTHEFIKKLEMLKKC